MSDDQKAMEYEVRKIREDLDKHIEADAAWKSNMLELVRSNEETNKTLAIAIQQVEENTRPIVQLSNDFQGAARIGLGVKKIILTLGFFGGLTLAVWHYFKNFIE